MSKQTLYTCDCCGKEKLASSDTMKIAVEGRYGKVQLFEVCYSCGEDIVNEIRFFA